MKTINRLTPAFLSALVLVLQFVLPAIGSNTPSVVVATQAECEASGGVWQDDGDIAGTFCGNCPSGTITSNDRSRCVSSNTSACVTSGGRVVNDDLAGSYCACPEGFKTTSDRSSCEEQTPEERCDLSGGEYYPNGTPGQQDGVNCICPEGRRLQNNTCVAVDDTDANDPEDFGGEINVPDPVTERQELEAEPTTNTCESLDGDCAIIKRFNQFLNLMAILIVPIVTIMMVIGGVQYSAANANPQQVQAAKSRIYKALLALISFMFMWSFLQWLLPGGVFS